MTKPIILRVQWPDEETGILAATKITEFAVVVIVAVVAQDRNLVSGYFLDLVLRWGRWFCDCSGKGEPQPGRGFLLLAGAEAGAETSSFPLVPPETALVVRFRGAAAPASPCGFGEVTRPLAGVAAVAGAGADTKMVGAEAAGVAGSMTGSLTKASGEATETVGVDAETPG